MPVSSMGMACATIGTRTSKIGGFALRKNQPDKYVSLSKNNNTQLPLRHVVFDILLQVAIMEILRLRQEGSATLRPDDLFQWVPEDLWTFHQPL